MSRSWKPLTKARGSSVSEMSFEIHGSKAQRGVWRFGVGKVASLAVGQSAPPPAPLDEALLEVVVVVSPLLEQAAAPAKAKAKRGKRRTTSVYYRIRRPAISARSSV